MILYMYIHICTSINTGKNVEIAGKTKNVSFTSLEKEYTVFKKIVIVVIEHFAYTAIFYAASCVFVKVGLVRQFKMTCFVLLKYILLEF